MDMIYRFADPDFADPKWRRITTRHPKPAGKP
jgi:hypothetical protein